MKQPSVKIIIIIICVVLIIIGFFYLIFRYRAKERNVIQPFVPAETEKSNKEKESMIKSLIPDTTPPPPDPEVIKSLIPDVAPPSPDPELIKSLIPHKSK